MAIAGPILGGLGAAAAWGLGEYLDSDLPRRAGVHRLLPQPLQPGAGPPLDGGRIVAAIHSSLWFVGLILLLGITIIAPNLIMLLILFLGGSRSWRCWQRQRHPRGRGHRRRPTAGSPASRTSS